MQALEEEIKSLVIEALNLEDITPADIDTDAALFGEGLGLDSIDALELGFAVHRRDALSLSAHSAETLRDFASVHALAAFVAAGRNK